MIAQTGNGKVASTTGWRHCSNGPNTKLSPNRPMRPLGPRLPPRSPSPIHSRGEQLTKSLSLRTVVSPGARAVGCQIARGGPTCLDLPMSVICRKIDGAKGARQTSRQDEQNGDSVASQAGHGKVVAHRWTFLVMDGWTVSAIYLMTISDLGRYLVDSGF